MDTLSRYEAFSTLYAVDTLSSYAPPQDRIRWTP